MTFDLKVPQKLQRTQLWFGSIIGRAINENSLMNPISPSGRPMEEEAWDYINPSPTMKPADRIQIYNQQYWWRLLNALQETFPLVTRLFGYHDFNQIIAIPYMVKYRPQDWSLSTIGDLLPTWIQEEYHASDKQLIYDSAVVDNAYNKSFIVGQQPIITAAHVANEGDMEALLDTVLYLQDHVHLMELKYDLIAFRTEFLKQDANYWVENDFPPLKKEKLYHFVLYRTQYNDIHVKEIPEEEYHLLSLFREGWTIDQACEWLENQENAIYQKAMEHLHQWFQEWIVLRWLALDTVPEKALI